MKAVYKLIFYNHYIQYTKYVGIYLSYNIPLFVCVQYSADQPLNLKLFYQFNYTENHKITLVPKITFNAAQKNR